MMGATKPDPRSLAAELHAAMVAAAPIEPLSERYERLTADDAYAIQRALLELVRAPDDSIVGYKVGLTSKAMQDMLGVDEPDFSSLLASMRVTSGGSVLAASLIQPKAEAEICIVLNKPLSGPGVTASDVREAASGVAAAIEVIDSRIVDWRIRLEDTVADLASSARFVVSDQVVPIEDFEPRLIGIVFEKNGTMVATGSGAAALGDPLEAAAWTINRLSSYGVAAEQGHIIMTGAVHAAVEVEAGDVVTATFDRLGAVTVHFR